MTPAPDMEDLALQGRDQRQEQERAAANDPQIRLFDAPNRASAKPEDDCDGRWAACTPASVDAFSCCGYFFARVLVARSWAPIAAGFPAVAVFVWMALGTTVLHYDRFDHDSLAFAAWAAIYFLAPPLLPVIYWSQRAARASDALLGGSLRIFMGVDGALVDPEGSGGGAYVFGRSGTKWTKGGKIEAAWALFIRAHVRLVTGTENAGDVPIVQRLCKDYWLKQFAERLGFPPAGAVALEDWQRGSQRRFGRVDVFRLTEQYTEPQQRRGRQRVAAGRAAVGEFLGARNEPLMIACRIPKASATRVDELVKNCINQLDGGINE